MNNENIGIKLVVDEHDSVFLVPNNFHIQTGPVKVECDGKYITFDKVKHVTIFKQGKNKRLTKLYYSEDAKPLSDKDVESKKLIKYKRTSQIRHLGDLGVVDAIYHQKYPLGMDTKHRATVRIIFRALANDGREEQPPAPSSQGHHHPVKPPGQKDVDAMPNVPAKNTAGKKLASYGNSGGAKKMVSKRFGKQIMVEESVNLNMAIMKKWFELRLSFLSANTPLRIPVGKMKQSCRAVMCNPQHRYQMKILSELR